MKRNDLPQISVGNFFEGIEIARKLNRHVDYLDRLLENFSWYNQTFQNVFTLDGEPNDLYLFRITYLMQSNVWRDVEIEGRQTFEHLAKKIVSSMGWKYDHMHGFTVPGLVKEAKEDIDFDLTTTLSFFQRHWEDDPFPVFKSHQIKIHQLDYKNHPMLEFTFDYGDGHRFKVVFNHQRTKTKIDFYEKFPQVVDQRGVAPKQYPIILEDLPDPELE